MASDDPATLHCCALSREVLRGDLAFSMVEQAIREHIAPSAPAAGKRVGNGAPDRIRTHDPQIRSREKVFEDAGHSGKPGCFQPYVDQWVTDPVANYFGLPSPEEKTPAQAGTGAGADYFSESAAAQVERYITGADPSSFDGTEPPQQVTAYVSRSTVYVIDAELRVVAYGPLTRREVLA